ncbi:MAG TPA: SDR family NAD(P)-dependent oxidoreductase [Gammaproteobacteria bacterium]|nr:SDR family NAD(P)-dependent oxidoreductase [Gammaproteobacteria bacterium]
MSEQHGLPRPSESTAVIVGVGPGLGLALVNAFAQQGYTVLAAARGAGAARLKFETGSGRVMPQRCDATDPEQVEALFAEAEAHGPVAAAVFNAGTFDRGTVVDTAPADFERCWRVGCFGGFLVGQAAARRMLERGAGTILFTGATASLRGGAGFVNLASPKFGLRAVAQSLARELAPRGVHVAHVIIDGQIRSERYAHLGAERGPDSLLEPEAIAAAYVSLHRQPRSAWTHELDLRPWVEKF